MRSGGSQTGLSEIRQFVFTRPRLLSRGESAGSVVLSADERLELSSIRIVVYPATATGTKSRSGTVIKGQAVAGVNKVVAKKGKAAAATRSGNVVATKIGKKTTKSKTTSHDIDYGTVLASARVRYAPEDQLQQLDVWTSRAHEIPGAKMPSRKGLTKRLLVAPSSSSSAAAAVTQVPLVV